MACVLALWAPAIAPARAELSRAAYEACAAQNEEGLREALTQISLDALKSGVGALDYDGLVGDAWRRHSVDEIIDKRVDVAVEDVKAETGWSELLQSITNSETAQKLATSVAERVYRSDAVKDALEAVAGDVAKDVGRAMESATSDASGPVVDCLKSFIGPRYGSAVAEAVAGDTGNLGVSTEAGGGDASAGAVLRQSREGIAGATILIVRRQLANLATRVGQRIAGSVLSRLVSVAAGGIGLVLIAKDIWELRNGVLPIIAGEMKAAGTKERVREEVAKTISEQIGEHVKEIAQASAAQVVNLWKEFKRAHAIVLRIAEADGAFRGFLDTVAPASMPRLDEIVALVVAEEGEASVRTRLDDGTLHEAVNRMPDKAVQIARETRSLREALAWSAVAGDRIGAVVEYDIHKRAKPSEFTQASLARVLSLTDRTAVMRMAGVPAKAREALFSLQGDDLNALARTLSDTELTTLASYLDGLQEAPRERVLRAVATSPGKMQILARDAVRDAIIASPSQGDAVAMMLETTAGFSPRAFASDVRLAAGGKVEPILLWHKHPAGMALAAVLSLVLMMWLMRLFRRPRAAAVRATTETPNTGIPPAGG